MRAAIGPVIAALVFATVCAADLQDTTRATPLPPVEVRALRDPVEKSYRKIVRGMDVFEERRALAPDASLRFKLVPRSRDTEMQGIALDIASENVSLPVQVSPDGTFALERVRQAVEEDAVVTPNRRAGSVTWRVDIRTPGLPPNTRRLGDLRLECFVGIEADLVSDFRTLLGHIARLLRPRDYCNQREVHYLFFTERPLFSVTLVAGSRRAVLPIDQLYAGISRQAMTATEIRYCDCEVLLDRTYYAPLSDPTWPDDTLLVFEYMDHGMPGEHTQADVRAALGESLVIRFDSGYEVWVYRLDNASPREEDPVRRFLQRKAKPPADEFIVLFAPSGVVAKTRIKSGSE